MTHSIIYKTKLESIHRLDAEYYQPYFFAIIRRFVKEFKGKPIGAFSFDITTGQYCKNYVSEDDGVPYIRGTDIAGLTIKEEGLYYISPRDQKKSKIAKENDIVVTRVGTIGLVALIPKRLEGATISDNLIRIRIKNKEEINSYYLATFLSSKFGKSLMIRHSRGSVQQRLNQETLKEIIIPTLPPAIQQKLVPLIQESFKLHQEAKELIDRAKREVEQMVENK